MTAGNMRKCYIGRKSDESLCDEGIRLAVSKISFFSSINIDCIFSSPMKRCIETADILFPQREIIIYENFAECDFGKF
jgi:alpha-ribazole phosphatase